jgi:hypothetical protein
MRKEILSELNQMKYLFGYKPGKVISEQSVPKTTGVTDTKSTQKTSEPTGVDIPQGFERKPYQKDEMVNTLVGEVLKAKAEGKNYFISKLFPKSIVGSIKKQGFKEDNNFMDGVSLFFIVFPIVGGKNNVTTHYDVQLNRNVYDKLQIANLDWKSLYDLWTSKKIKIRTSYPFYGKERIDIRKGASNLNLQTVYALLLSDENGDTIDSDQERRNVIEVLQTFYPDALNYLLKINTTPLTPSQQNTLMKWIYDDRKDKGEAPYDNDENFGPEQQKLKKLFGTQNQEQPTPPQQVKQ